MTGFFCKESAATEEAYRRILHKRIRIWILMAAAGILMLLFVWAAGYMGMTADEDIMTLYIGFAVGITAAGIALIWKNSRLLKDEEKLRKARIAAADERNAEIRTAALRAALCGLLIGMYLVMLIGGIYAPIVAKVLSFLICLFLLVYLAAYKIMEKKI